MKIQTQRDHLLRLLQNIVGVVERRHTMPVLANILVVAEDGRLSLTATDLEVELSATSSQVIDQPGKITIPGRKLFDILRALPDEADLTLSVESGKAVMRSGRSRFSLATLPADLLPALDDFSVEMAMEVSQPELKGLIERTHFAMAQQDVRYYLNGLMLEFSTTGIRAVATDGHRLALDDVPATLHAPGTDDGAPARQIILPRKGVQELLRLLSDDPESTAQLSLGSNHLRVILDGIHFTTKLVDGRFPDYQRAIPEPGERVATVDRRELRAALSRAAILSNENRGVRLELDAESMRIQSNNPEQEEVEEELPIEFQGSPLQIGFNVSYLIEALGVLSGEQAIFYFSDAASSCLLRDAGMSSGRYVISPMRL